MKLWVEILGFYLYVIKGFSDEEYIVLLDVKVGVL